MAAQRHAEEAFINSIVGPGTMFRGHVELNGLLRIDGDFSGSIKTDGRVIIGQRGRADCAIEAGSVVIGGLFRGEILASEKIVLLSSSIVVGRVSAPRLVVESGVRFSGTCQISGNDTTTDRSFIADQKKKLLLESIRTREQSDAVRRTADDRDDAVAAESSKWSG